MQATRGLGWVPDVPSTQDYTEVHPKIQPLLASTRALAPRAALLGIAPSTERPLHSLPSKIDLRSDFSPVEDQGALGSCTAQAAIALLEYFERKTKGTHVDHSRLFLYKAERNLLGWSGDTGAYIRTAMQALVLFGSPPEHHWPYDGRPAGENTRYDLEPPAFCYAYGARYQAVKYFRLDPNAASTGSVLQNVRSYLAAGFPSMFGFPVHPEFDHPRAGGLIPIPGPASPQRGGHAIVAVGYDDSLQIGPDKGALLVRNSWGTGWGVGGYGWLSYRYVTDGLAVDWWTLISASWAPQF